jgi:hypothetical protein
MENIIVLLTSQAQESYDIYDTSGTITQPWHFLKNINNTTSETTPIKRSSVTISSAALILLPVQHNMKRLMRYMQL